MSGRVSCFFTHNLIEKQNDMRRQTTNYTSIWSTSSDSSRSSAANVGVAKEPAPPVRRMTGKFSYVIEGWTLFFEELCESVIDEKKIYFDQVKITGGFGPGPTGPMYDFFDGTRLFISEDPTWQPDGSYRSLYERKMDPNHFEIRQTAGTFVLTSLSASGTKVNDRIVLQGETVVLCDKDRIEDRVIYEVPSWYDM